CATRGDTAGGLIDRLVLQNSCPEGPDWRTLLELNLRVRLAELIAVHRDAHDLRDQVLGHKRGPVNDRVARLLADAHPPAAHHDPGLALRAAVGALISVCATCTFWIVTAWPDGASAAMWVAICCTLFANVDSPAPMVLRTLFGNAVGFALAMLYAFAILP